MKANDFIFSFLYLPVHPPSARKTKHGIDYEIKEVTQAAQGFPTQTYWKLIPKDS